jgi:hypothetical protein
MENKQQTKEANDVRIGMNTRVGNVIKYCTSILAEKKLRELHFSAVGGAIGTLISVVEVLRIINPGMNIL